MKKSILLIGILFILFISNQQPALAEVVIDDGFTDTSQVDLTKTTARVDTTEHSVLLPWASLTGAVDMLQEGMGYAVASKDGVNVYEYDDATGGMAENSLYSCPWATDATGVSVRQDNLNLWVVGSDSLAYYKFNGGGMTNDPALKIAGLTDVFSVSAIKNTDTALLLQSEGNEAKITKYSAGAGLNPAMVFQPHISDPIKLSMVDDSPDFRLFTKTAAYYFMYDEAGNTYVEDPARKITGLTDVLSAGSDATGNTVLNQNEMNYYMNIDGGGAAQVDVFSPGPVNAPVAVSLKSGTYEQVFLDENGDLQWWTYDDFTESMVRNSDLEVSGLNLNTGYAHPKNYFSKAVATPNYDAARLAVTEDKPAGTSISYSISSNGGVTFNPIVPGTWTAVPRGSSFVVKAVLETTDAQQTPKILHLTLEVDEDLVLEGFVSPDPAERGRNVTVSARGVSLTSGGSIALDSCSVRYPLEETATGDPALLDGQTPSDAAMVYNAGTGFWEYTFAIPEKSVDGRWPDNGVYQVRVTGIKGASTKQLVLNLEVSGNILQRLIIRTMSW